jgi:hypothetical protein
MRGKLNYYNGHSRLKSTLKENPDNSERMAHLQMERDYNPKLANEELAKLIKKEAIEQGASKKKKKRDKQKSEAEDPDDLFGALFDETESPVKSNSLTQASVVRDMSYTGWTGKSPRQLLMVMIQLIVRTGFRRIIKEHEQISQSSTMDFLDSDSKSCFLVEAWKHNPLK